MGDENALNVGAFMDALGYGEEPLGVAYTDNPPGDGFSPRPADLPDRGREARGEVDWEALFGNFSCVVRHVWRARRNGKPASFDTTRFGCLGGAFFLGYLKPQLEAVIHYVSTGGPGREGEHYIDRPERFRAILDHLDPRPAPARYCVFQPLSRFLEGDPELVIFFARPEVLSGLHQLATFVSGDPEVVASPWGAACANLVAWPLHYLATGRPRAVLGGWDPSARVYLKTDELTFAVPWSLFRAMADRWQESFLAHDAWRAVRKKVGLSRRTWGEA